ncbi:hypothetical protein ERC79_14420 [Rhodococcus sp. ABRD24]|uniref:septum site-determining protein Ssd n=1 Tax=Rhodococcus sp. ABRD24 TaxID=2507582 RepID=UPI00103EFB6F|nr:septum site-determining protein Ssd [Rhodococcus sp. ABRD24]QBJ97013.1 hypothetical protein ERC79_14420 [Rhodococcus sp. ABRD24]
MDNDTRASTVADRPGVLAWVNATAVAHCLRSVAAATNQTFDACSELPARSVWSGASLVVLDAAAARECATRLPRRRGVVLVCDGVPTLADWQAATGVGADHVLGLPAEEADLVTVFGDHGMRREADGAVVAVVGGCGGAGASTLAAALALEAARPPSRSGSRVPSVLLLDADPFGGGLDLLLGIEDTPGLRWSGLSVEGGRVSADALHAALPGRGPGLSVLACGRGPLALSGPTPPAAIAVAEAGRCAGNVVICDVSRQPSPAGDGLLDIADLIVMVIPARVRAGLSAERVLARVAERNPHQGIVVRGPAPGGLRGTDIAGALGAPLLAAMRPEPQLEAMLERGGLQLSRRSPLSSAARSVLGVLGARPRGRW